VILLELRIDGPLHDTIEEFAADGYRHVECHCPRCRVIRPKADQLASPHLDGPNHRAAISAAPLFRVRRAGSFGQAVANGRCVGQAAGAKRLAASLASAGTITGPLAVGELDALHGLPHDMLGRLGGNPMAHRSEYAGACWSQLRSRKSSPATRLGRCRAFECLLVWFAVSWLMPSTVDALPPSRLDHWTPTPLRARTAGLIGLVQSFEVRLPHPLMLRQVLKLLQHLCLHPSLPAASATAVAEHTELQD
jgi:hypothetical protein